MSSVLAFMGDHPIVTVLLAWAVCNVLTAIVSQPFRAWNRWLRSKNIRERGWPTVPNMDADGDIVHPKQESRS